MELPSRLEVLALEAISCSVADLGCKFLKCSQDERLWKACDNFGELLEEYVPPILASQITARLLRQVDELLTGTHSSSDENLYKLVRAVTLPLTSALDLSHIMASFPLMCTRIQTLTCLRSLRLRRSAIPAERESIAMALHYMPHLEEFQCWYGCSDEIIKNIPKTLRQLDVCWSRNVTDASIVYIIMLKRNLEDIRVSGTNISEEGLQELLSNLRTESGTHNRKLKSFECNKVNEKHVELLAKGFPYLQQVVLGVSTDTCDISVLSLLEHLRILRFSNGNISGINKFLKHSGHRLRELELIGSHPDVIFKIGKYCNQLECLIFTSDSSVWSPSVPCYSRGFSSLQQATLDLNKEELVEVLKHCINLKILCLYHIDEDIISDILVHCKASLKQLLELYCPGSLLSGEFATTVIEHCPNLRLLEGIDTGLELLRRRYPELRIS